MPKECSCDRLEPYRSFEVQTCPHCFARIEKCPVCFEDHVNSCSERTAEAKKERVILAQQRRDEKIRKLARLARSPRW